MPDERAQPLTFDFGLDVRLHKDYFNNPGKICLTEKTRFSEPKNELRLELVSSGTGEYSLKIYVSEAPLAYQGRTNPKYMPKKKLRDERLFVLVDENGNATKPGEPHSFLCYAIKINESQFKALKSLYDQVQDVKKNGGFTTLSPSEKAMREILSSSPGTLGYNYFYDIAQATMAGMMSSYPRPESLDEAPGKKRQKPPTSATVAR